MWKRGLWMGHECFQWSHLIASVLAGLYIIRLQIVFCQTYTYEPPPFMLHACPDMPYVISSHHTTPHPASSQAATLTVHQHPGTCIHALRASGDDEPINQCQTLITCMVARRTSRVATELRSPRPLYECRAVLVHGVLMIACVCIFGDPTRTTCSEDHT